MKRAKSGRDFGLSERYNVDRRSIGDLSRIGPGLPVEVVDGKSDVLIRLK